MSSKAAFKNIIKVSASNIIKLLSGVLVGFLLPKIIGVADYGYYKTFTLYASYVGLFHFGLSDGIYLKYGGKNFDELNKEEFRMFSSSIIILESLVSFLTFLVTFFLLLGEVRFIFFCLAVFLFVNNITSYFQMISQITGRFDELSLRNVVQSLLTCLSLVFLWICHHFFDARLSYKVYTVVHVSIMGFLFVWYLITYKDIVFGKRIKIWPSKKCLLGLIKIGLPLMVANLTSTLILTLDRQFVNILFDTSSYAVYAFAYNMLSLITTALIAISTVLYPLMKRKNQGELVKNYSLVLSCFLVFVFACLLAYFPLGVFVKWFLPKYVESLPVFRVILPGLAIQSAITIVMHNYYKTLNKNLEFFIKSLIVLVLSGIANYVAYILFKTTIAISVASIIIMSIWYLLIEEFFVRSFRVKWIKNLSYMVVMTTGFYLITMWQLWWASMLVYFAALVSVTYLFYFKDINRFLKGIFSKKSTAPVSN